MSRIKIKYFGPIKEISAATDGWIDIWVSLHLSESVTQQYVGEKNNEDFADLLEIQQEL